MNLLRLNCITTACVLLLVGASAQAQTYAVQIGAFSNPNAQVLDEARRIGDLYTAPAPNGLTRYRVGPFATEQLALRARDTLRQLGFPDAFIKVEQEREAMDQPPGEQMSDAEPSPATSEVPAKLVSSGRRELSGDEVQYLMSLSPAERSAVVYLDGRLHKKIDGEFVPISP